MPVFLDKHEKYTRIERLYPESHPKEINRGFCDTANITQRADVKSELVS